MSGVRGPEWDLIEAAQAGDRDAFGRLYAQYSPRVTGFLQARLRDRALAEDLTSETFVRALRRIDSVSYQLADPGAWLTTIARNLVRDHWKSSRYRRERPTAEISASASAQEGPEDVVIREDTATELHRCVDQLSEDQQECVRSRFLHELSVAETAARMGRSESAIKALTHRGVQRLRASMQGEAAPGVAKALEVKDSLVAARRALAQLRERQVERERHAAEVGRADQVARWHAEDQDSALSVEPGAQRGVSAVTSAGAGP